MWLLVPTLLALGCTGDSAHRSSQDTHAAVTEPDRHPSGDSDSEPTDTGEGDTGEPPPDDGYLSMVWVRADHGAPAAYLIGELYEVLTPGVSGVEFAQPASLDDCALTSYTLADLGQGELPTYDRQTAGPLTLTSSAPDTSVTVSSGSGHLYYRDLDPDLVPLGGAYAVEAPGDTFPAFSVALAVPGPREILAPQPGFTASGPLHVQWSGGDPGELLLRVQALDDSGARGLILCRVDNDGAHTVAADLIEQLPGGRVSVHLQQQHQELVSVGGRWLRVSGAVVDTVAGGAP